jgi:hypothetical protein
MSMKGFLVVALGALAFAVTPAVASTGEGSGGGYSTSVSLSCVAGVCGSSVDPLTGATIEYATAGDTVASTATFTNNTSRPAKGTIVVTIASPAGIVSAYTNTINVAPGKTWSRAVSYVVSATDPLGVYTATTSIGGLDGASASASITVD